MIIDFDSFSSYTYAQSYEQSGDTTNALSYYQQALPDLEYAASIDPSFYFFNWTLYFRFKTSWEVLLS